MVLWRIKSSKFWQDSSWILSHWLETDILQTIFLNSFSSMNIIVFWFKFHWNLFQMGELTIRHHNGLVPNRRQALFEPMTLLTLTILSRISCHADNFECIHSVTKISWMWRHFRFGVQNINQWCPYVRLNGVNLVRLSHGIYIWYAMLRIVISNAHYICTMCQHAGCIWTGICAYRMKPNHQVIPTCFIQLTFLLSILIKSLMNVLFIFAGWTASLA